MVLFRFKPSAGFPWTNEWLNAVSSPGSAQRKFSSWKASALCLTRSSPAEPMRIYDSIPGMNSLSSGPAAALQVVWTPVTPPMVICTPYR